MMEYKLKCSNPGCHPALIVTSGTVRDEDDYCGDCGAKIMCIVLECPRCKHTSVHDTFCTKCGTLLIEKNLKV